MDALLLPTSAIQGRRYCHAIARGITHVYLGSDTQFSPLILLITHCYISLLFKHFFLEQLKRLWCYARCSPFSESTMDTLRASLSGYATEGALFISAQLSTDAFSALQKVWVLHVGERKKSYKDAWMSEREEYCNEGWMFLNKRHIINWRFEPRRDYS